MSIIEVKGLRKTFVTTKRREGLTGAIKDLFVPEKRTFEAVKGISFSVESGEMVGYLGPNGAGKSTSIKMLTGVLKPSGGDMSVLGYHPFRQREQYTRHIGVVFGQRTQLWWDLAVIESLKLLGKIYGVSPKQFEEKLAVIVEVLDLKEILHLPVRKLSLGQRIRSDLAASLIHSPPVLFLDEPTIGLDALGKESTRRFLKTMNEDFKTTIVLTTHDLTEVEELCQRIIVVDRGQLIFDGELDDIRRMPGLNRVMRVDFSSVPRECDFQEILPPGVGLEAVGEKSIRMLFDPHKIRTVDILRTLGNTCEIADVTVTEPDIEEIIRKLYRDGRGP
jgi:ABC-2 type transport system ATP-binding protein